VGEDKRFGVYFASDSGYGFQARAASVVRFVGEEMGVFIRVCVCVVVVLVEK